MSAVEALVVLHGYDSSAKVADELAGDLDPEGRWRHVVPEGPIQLAGGERAWFEVDEEGSVTRAARLVRSVIDALVDQGGIAPDAIAVVGYSQGAAAALAAVAATEGAAVGRVVTMNGFVVEEPGLHYRWTRLRPGRVLLQHGERDDVVPSFFSADLAALLHDAGVAVDHQAFPMGHERTVASLAAARAWLEEDRARR